MYCLEDPLLWFCLQPEVTWQINCYSTLWNLISSAWAFPCCHFYLKMSYSSTTGQNILKGNQQKFLSLPQRFECFPASSWSNSINFISCIGIPIPLLWLLCEYLLLSNLCCLLFIMWPYIAHSNTKAGHEAQNDVWDSCCFRMINMANAAYNAGYTTTPLDTKNPLKN